MFPIGPVSRHTLFQIHVEKIVAAARRYGVRIPLYLMTSPATHDETVAFFAEHNRFGLPEDDLIIFCQGTMPAVDAATGHVLLEAPAEIAAESRRARRHVGRPGRKRRAGRRPSAAASAICSISRSIIRWSISAGRSSSAITCWPVRSCPRR